MSTIVLEAEIREDMGKGASRRLRRLENKVPAIVYGGHKEPKMIHLLHNKVIKALESESIYSSVFDLKINGKAEKVILKDLQRHPVKPVILHMDLQRVSAKDVLVKMVPLHFVNEDKAPGAKAGGIFTHTMSQVEIRCQAKDLPEFIEADLGAMKLNDILHLSDLKLPAGVQLATDPKVGDHDHPVVSIHMPRVVAEEEPTVENEQQEDEGSESDVSEAKPEESAEE